MNKTTSIRLDDLDKKRIQEMKEYYAECWDMDPKDFTTTEIISWCIGIAHLVKYQYDIDLSEYPSLEK